MPFNTSVSNFFKPAFAPKPTPAPTAASPSPPAVFKPAPAFVPKLFHAFCAALPTPAICPNLPLIPPCILIFIPKIFSTSSGAFLTKINVPITKNNLAKFL